METTPTPNAALVASFHPTLVINSRLTIPPLSDRVTHRLVRLGVRERLGNNVTAHATSRLLKQLLADRDVSNYRKIQEYVMGSYSTGSAFTTGKIALELAPSSERGMLNIHFTEKTNVRDNVAYRGSVAIYSKCNTLVDAHKPVFIDAEGIDGGESRAQCSSNIQVDDVDAKRRVVRELPGGALTAWSGTT